MSKSYKITYSVDGDDYIEYFSIQKERDGKYIGTSAQNNFYDEIVFGFGASKPIKELDGLIEKDVAIRITEEEFIDGFNGMLKRVKEGCKSNSGRK